MERDREHIIRWNRRFVCGFALCLSWLFFPVSLHAQTHRFRVALTYDTHQLSAILILKRDGETLKGGMMNEFGVNLVEFSVKKGKAKIARLNPLFKKPFLKKVLKKDFELITESLQREMDGMSLSKRGGMYRATCLRETDEETKWLSLRLEHQKLPLSICLYQI